MKNQPEFRVTMIDHAGLLERLAVELRFLVYQLRLAWPDLKRDPIGFSRRTILEGWLQLRRAAAPDLLAAFATAMLIVLSAGLILVLISNRSKTGQPVPGNAWERVQIVAKNHGLIRVWTQHSAPLWHQLGFKLPSTEVAQRRPAAFSRAISPLDDTKAVSVPANGRIVKVASPNPASAMRRGPVPAAPQAKTGYRPLSSTSPAASSVAPSALQATRGMPLPFRPATSGRASGASVVPSRTSTATVSWNPIARREPLGVNAI